jgi:HAD superfamily hydrolase (TIGR01662 family)
MDTLPIRYILFDLGGTLMHSRGDWAPVFERSDQALADVLRTYNIELDAKTFRARLHEYYAQRENDFQETTYHFVLCQLLKELGYARVAESIVRAALDAMFEITQANWVMEDDTLETVRQLKSSKYKLGIFSNAGDDKDVRTLVWSMGLRPQFDFVLTSAACFYRKPHPRAFEIALARWNIQPEEAVMVGDSLQADIFGAKRLKMKTVWIARRAQFTPEEKQNIDPDFEISTLGELLPVLERVNLGLC